MGPSRVNGLAAAVDERLSDRQQTRQAPAGSSPDRGDEVLPGVPSVWVGVAIPRNSGRQVEQLTASSASLRAWRARA
ncbi:hypothetical protein GY24_12130 [Microterricola pindariensis]|uniref:Uncharacterized protein n=1 Tax=Microterricola pindariensis TaxID=478010 RepID=A0ABX5AVG4_9MICO|nr:hypothetical protein GY24_12130 [Microterricola pindariensis]